MSNIILKCDKLHIKRGDVIVVTVLKEFLGREDVKIIWKRVKKFFLIMKLL